MTIVRRTIVCNDSPKATFADGQAFAPQAYYRARSTQDDPIERGSMKIGRFTSILAISGLLTGCSSGTPGCADSDTLAVIDEAIKNEVAKYAAHTRLSTQQQFLEIGESYKISSIRTLEHDKTVDSYQCDARVTYQLKGREQSADFSYRVDTDQSDGNVLVQYQKKMLAPIMSFFMSG